MMNTRGSRWPWIIGGTAAAAAVSYLALSYSDMGNLGHDPQTIKKPQVDADRYFQNKAGLWIYMRQWDSEGPPVGFVFIIHGLGEHAGRIGYHNLAREFAKKNYIVCALDHQGHGMSNGSRAYVVDYNDFLDDVEQFIEIKTKAWELESKVPPPKLPVFLFGHSMGGAITLGTVMFRNIPNLAGIVLSGPAINLHRDKNYSDTVRAVGRQVAKIAPKFPSVPPIPIYELSRNRDACEAYRDDPLIYHGGILANLGSQLIQLSERMDMQWEKIQTPMLVVHGGSDVVVDPGAAQVLKECKASVKDKEVVILPNLLHELLEDPDAEQVINKVVEWVVKRTPIAEANL